MAGLTQRGDVPSNLPNSTSAQVTGDVVKRRQQKGLGEYTERVAVFAALMLVFAAPMWHWPRYCNAVLWAWTAAGTVEWLVSTWPMRANVWLWAIFLAWAAPTAVALAQYQRVIGHRLMVECVFIQLAVGDSAQLLWGRSCGRTYVCPRISPRKTLEGYVGGALTTLAYGTLVHGWRPNDIVLVYAAGCIGDLFFSGIKRRLGLKDFSCMLCSMGGVLDRIDSLIFAGNALYWTALLAGHS